MDGKAAPRFRTLLPLISLLALALPGNPAQANDSRRAPTPFSPRAAQRDSSDRLQSSCIIEILEASISGRVRFRDTGEPIQGVLIENPTTGELEFTDNDGRFAFTGLPYQIQTLRNVHHYR